MFVSVMIRVRYKNILFPSSFTFKPFNLNYAALSVGGEYFPAEGYTPDFKNKLYAREYYSLFSNTGLHHLNAGNGITYENFADGNFFLAWDLTPDLCGGFHLHPPVLGTTELHLRFAEALSESITILAYASYDSQVLLHGDRTVSTATVV